MSDAESTFLLNLVSIGIGKEIDHPAVTWKARRVHDAGGNVVAVAFAIDASHSIDCEFQFAINHDAPLFAVRMGQDVAARFDVKENNLSRRTLRQPAAHAAKTYVNFGKRSNAGRKE